MKREDVRDGVQVISRRGTNEEERGAIRRVVGDKQVEVEVRDKASGVSYYAVWNWEDLEVAPTEGMLGKFTEGFKKTASDTSGGMTGGATGTEQ